MTIRNWGPVRECMTTDVTKVDGRIDVLTALKIMRKEDANSLIIKRRDENDEWGMVLFSDIARQVIAKNRAPERVNVYEIMTKPVLRVSPDMEVRYCARLFENFGISQASVVENNEIVGMISYYAMVMHGVLPDLE